MELWGGMLCLGNMEVKLHLETQKRNRIVKLYCVFDAVQCWCALFPPPPPRRQWHNIPQSLPPTPAWPWTCPDSTRKYKSPLSSINWGNIMGEWTEIFLLKALQWLRMLAPVTIFCEFFPSVIEIVRLGASKLICCDLSLSTCLCRMA